MCILLLPFDRCYKILPCYLHSIYICCIIYSLWRWYIWSYFLFAHSRIWIWEKFKYLAQNIKKKDLTPQCSWILFFPTLTPTSGFCAILTNFNTLPYQTAGRYNFLKGIFYSMWKHKYNYQTRCSRGWSTNSLVIQSVILFLLWRVITALSHSKYFNGFA